MTDQEKVTRMIAIRLEERPDLKEGVNTRVWDMFKPGHPGYYDMLNMYNKRYPEGE